MRSILNRKPLVRLRCQRIECYFNSVFIEIHIQYFHSGHCRHKCRNSLLPVNQNMPAVCHRTVLCMYIWIFPGNNITRRITIVKGINQIPHLCFLPHKRSLYLRNHKLPRLYQPQYGTHRILHQRKLFSLHSFTCSPVLYFLTS